ncbi:MAG: hypothetical protein GXY07_14745 [Candidatus Hydrogenedentes bacterium]|nr:hypothetical protein [Candidatus Hydrogenedentota bacterium]
MGMVSVICLVYSAREFIKPRVHNLVNLAGFRESREGVHAAQPAFILFEEFGQPGRSGALR